MTFTLLARRTAAIVLGAGGVMLALAGPAVADSPPGCSVADFTSVATGVDAATTAYLFTHPDVNAFFSGLQGQPKASVKPQVQAYLQANPQVQAELQAITAPGEDLRRRCNIPDEAIVLGSL
jgi:hemophore-related protein